MQKEYIKIENIPALIWGDSKDRLFIAVHGDKSNKEDKVIELIAQEAARKNIAVLSFDLDEVTEPELAVKQIRTVTAFARARYKELNLFAVSLGAYLSMLALEKEDISQSLFLSPVVDIKRLIENIMLWMDVTAERLKREKEIHTDIQTLRWVYYDYICTHPVKWNKPTAILCGEFDNVSEPEYVKEFARICSADLTVMQKGQHYFHTPKQLKYFSEWLRVKIL